MKNDWESQYWQLVEKEGVGADIRFLQHLRNLFSTLLQQQKEEILEKLDAKFQEVSQKDYLMHYIEGWEDANNFLDSLLGGK